MTAAATSLPLSVGDPPSYRRGHGRRLRGRRSHGIVRDRVRGKLFRRGRDRGAAPGCWRAAFDVAGDGDLLIVQQLLLAINAHVNFDLPQVVVAVADRTGDLPSIRPDFEAVNAVLSATYDDVLDDLDRMTRWTGRVAAMGGGHLFNFSLRGRHQAWRAAVNLYPLPPDARRAQIEQLDRLVSVLAYLITRPTGPFSWFAGAVRRLENRDPAAVTRVLLGPLA